MTIKGLEEFSEEDIRIMIADYIDDILSSSDICEKEFRYLDMKLVGSRINGNSRKDSDLDVVVYYSGVMREDSAFNIFNDDSYRLYINGIMVDINTVNILDKEI